MNNEITHTIKENTWLSSDLGNSGLIDFGWGNGYVFLPEGHKYYEYHYNDIEIYVHGGLTFSELVTENMINLWGLPETELGKWCIGFDTCHDGDTIDKWTEEKVLAETLRLKEQMK